MTRRRCWNVAGECNESGDGSTRGRGHLDALRVYRLAKEQMLDAIERFSPGMSWSATRMRPDERSRGWRRSTPEVWFHSVLTIAW